MTTTEHHTNVTYLSEDKLKQTLANKKRDSYSTSRKSSIKHPSADLNDNNMLSRKLYPGDLKSKFQDSKNSDSNHVLEPGGFRSFTKTKLKRHNTIGTVDDVTSRRDSAVKSSAPLRPRHQNTNRGVTFSWSKSVSEEMLGPKRSSIDLDPPYSRRLGVLEEGNAGKRTRKLSNGSEVPVHKVSFQAATAKVSNLLKVKAARKLSVGAGTIRPMSSVAEDEADLPTTPRFSSFLSPEAQYALMKGYEDIIADKLTSKFPEYNGMLKRNKTPYGITILEQGLELSSDIDQHNHSDDKNVNHLNSKPHLVSNLATGSNFESQIKQKEPDLFESKVIEKNILNKNSPAPKHDTQTCLENLRRLSLSFSSNAEKEKDNAVRNLDIDDLDDPGLRRHSMAATSVLPLPHERRRVLSQRMETAMDLLDTIRPQWEHALSPRVKHEAKHQIAPLVDYNRWADQWATEFQSSTVQ
ncbi:uncharacterized protein LOC131942143 [Physella acuta]|uniref:uncharacterized protein LOC131942143 n=1 Tax=Physella acuta TaxID=109671 RepID=UPI0027DB2A39|nr:uncharacterized protein LOC131942143 [Physella acuta]